MLLARLKTAFVIALTAMSLWTSAATAQEPKWRHGMAVVGDLKLPADFKHLPFVDANAPKCGEVRLGD